LGIDESCIELDFDSEKNSIEYINALNKDAIKFNQETEIDFFIVCQSKEKGILILHDESLMNCPESCTEFCCLSSFGANPTVKNWLSNLD